ncbi:hypothetical protein D9M68_743850 [compost metagenome]
MLSSTAFRRCSSASSFSTLVALNRRRASAIRPKRRISAAISFTGDSGRVTWKFPWPIWSAALARASMGSPKRRAMPWAVMTPISSTATPSRPIKLAISTARSRAAPSAPPTTVRDWRCSSIMLLRSTSTE